MFRLVFMTFYGEFRGTEDQAHHLDEAPRSMTAPLWILAGGAIVTGFLGMPFFWPGGDWIGHFLQPVIAHVGDGHGGHHAEIWVEWVLMGVSVTVAGLGILMAWRTWGQRGLEGGEKYASRMPGLHRLLVNKYWVDELYDATVIRGFWATARGLFRFDKTVIDGFFVNGTRHLTVAISLLSGFFDKYFVDGLVNFSGWLSRAGSRFFRGMQTGVVSQYALVVGIGTFILVCYFVITQ
jgi:NADH-quinone oxidoreductase subunit L